MKKNQFFRAFFIFSFVGGLVQAEELSFQTAWKIISDKSSAQKAVQLESEAANVAKKRSALHWLPRLYVDVKSYQTNDPGNSFIGILEQRAVAGTDFNPALINQPEQQLYTRGALGLDLPLYEGGMKSAEYRMQKYFLNSKEVEVNKIRNEQYAEVAKAFGSIAVLDQQKIKLFEMNKTLERLLKGYKLGIKSNPVGYSGLLGLQSLSNRLQGLLNQYNFQSEALVVSLKEMGLEQASDWKPQFDNVSVFTQNFLSADKLDESYSAEVMKIKSQAQKEVSRMEKARFLPRLGFFAETYNFKGNRETANGYTAGLYLQWNLFNPADYGAYKESSLKALAAENFSQAFSEKERSEYYTLKNTAASLKANIDLLNESQKIMTEQMRVTENLFKNGSVNALQFVEVLSRRVDLIAAQSEAQLGYIKAVADKTLKTHFIIPAAAEGK